MLPFTPHSLFLTLTPDNHLSLLHLQSRHFQSVIERDSYRMHPFGWAFPIHDMHSRPKLCVSVACPFPLLGGIPWDGHATETPGFLRGGTCASFPVFGSSK